MYYPSIRDLIPHSINEAVVSFLADRPNGRRFHVLVALNGLKELPDALNIGIRIFGVSDAPIADNIVYNLQRKKNQTVG